MSLRSFHALNEPLDVFIDALQVFQKAALVADFRFAVVKNILQRFPTLRIQACFIFNCTVHGFFPLLEVVMKFPFVPCYIFSVKESLEKSTLASIRIITNLRWQELDKWRRFYIVYFRNIALVF